MLTRPRALSILLVTQIACCAFLHLGAITAQDAVTHPDHNLIQGYWRRTSSEHHGKRGGPLGGGSRILHKGKVTGKGALLGVVSGKYVIRPDESPKEIDITGRKGKILAIFADEEYKRLGIYEVNLLTLTICESSSERPTHFRTAPGLDWYLKSYRRVVWETDPDLDTIAGKWRIARLSGRSDFSRTASRVRRRDGWIRIAKKRKPSFMEIPPPAGFPRAKIERICETVGHFYDESGNEFSKFEIRIDSTQTPASIRLSPGGSGVYRLDDDTLTIRQRQGPSWFVVLER